MKRKGNLKNNFRYERLIRLIQHRGFTAAAAVVVFVTTYALILPAVTASTATYCGLEEHTHSAECYTVEKTLTCGQEESDGHVHTDACYETELVCGQEENDGHVHTDSCYTEEQVLTCTNTDADHVHDDSCYTTEKVLTCGLEEGEGAHHHDDSCYQKVLICGLEEGEGAHHHDDSCYTQEEILTCDQEEHTHTQSCYSNPEADLETAASWTNTFKNAVLTGNWSEDILTIADTQLGYTESSENYIVDDEENKYGYTRYGAWYGDPYGDWCAMFSSFCINYAGIPTTEAEAQTLAADRLAADPAADDTIAYFPISEGCQQWIELLNRAETPYYYAVNDNNSYTLANGQDALCRKDPSGEDTCGLYHPQAGDLIFFNWDEEADADHVGIIYSISYDNDGSLQTIKTIEGNSNDTVKYNTYSADDSRIMGFAQMPENPGYEEAEAEDQAESTEVSEAEPKTEAAAENTEETTENTEEITESTEAESENTEAESENTAVTAEETEEDSNNTEAASGSFEITDQASDGTTVSVSGDSDSLPADAEDVSVSITRLSQAKALELAEAAGVDTDLYDVYAYDVSLYDGNTEIEPEDTVTVTFENEDTIGKIGTTKVYHFDEETADSEKMVIKDADEGYVQFETDSFSKYLVTTEGVTYDSDLKDFLASATMTDYAGNTITNGSTVYIGQDYTITMSFAESNVVGKEKQFHYDDEGYLTYQVDTTNLVLKEVTNAPITQDDGTVVGHYWLSTDGTLKVQFDNVDNAGAAISNTYFDEYKNTVFNLTFDATVTANSAGQEIKIPFSDDISITGKVDAGGDLKVTKTAGSANSAKHSMDFTVEVKCTEGVVSNIVLTDTPNSKFKGTLYSATIDTASITFTDLDGNALAEQPSVTKNDDGTYTIKYPTSLQAGEGFLIKYNMIAGDDAYEAMTEYCLENDGTKVSGNVNFLNTVKVTGDNGTETPVDKTTNAEKTSYTTLMGKSHSDTTIKDNSGNTIDVIKWTVSIGDNSKNFGGQTLTDTIGSALTFLTDSGNYDYIKLWYKDANGHASYVYYYFDEAKKAADTSHTTGLVTLSSDGKTATITLPDDCYDASLEYYTTYSMNDDDTDAYKNTASVTGTGYGSGKASDSSTAGVGVPNIEKTTTGADADYIYYQIKVDVPGSLYGEYMNIMDRGIDTNTGGISFGCRMEYCKDFKVTVQKDSDSSPVEYTYSSSPGTGTYNWSPQDGGNYWSLWLNNSTSSTDQKWPIDEHSVLTITFAYPRTVVSEGKSINDVLWEGYYVRNQARVYYVSNKNQKTVYATYYTTSEMNKTGQKITDGRMYYEVGYATYTTDNTTNTRTAALEKPFSNAYLYDDYDSKTSFDTSYGIMCGVVNVKTGKLAYFQIDSTDIEFNESDSSLKAYWKKFKADDNYTDLGVTKGTDMETFLNSQDLANYKLYFMYFVTPTHTAVEASPDSINLSNTAKIGYTGTTDYESQGVSFDYTYTTDLLDKTGTQSVTGGNEINYTIDLNSDYLDLSDSDTYQVEDQMSDNMSLYLDSIVFTDAGWTALTVTNATTKEEFIAAYNAKYTDGYAEEAWENDVQWFQNNCKVTYDEANHKIAFTVPDGYHVTITYTTKISETGSSVKVSNTATIKGLTSKSSGGEATYEVNNTSGSAAGSKKYMYVLKQNSSNKESVIGAKIALYGETDKGITAPDGVDQTITVNGKTLYYYATYESATNTNQALNGTFTITDDYLADGGFYALKEIEAPDGYVISKDPIPFYWEIQNVSEKDGIEVKSSRDTMIFQNTPQAYALPSTGGMGTTPFTIAGLLLMAGAVFMAVLKCKGKTGKL